MFSKHDKFEIFKTYTIQSSSKVIPIWRYTRYFLRKPVIHYAFRISRQFSSFY